MAELWPWCPPFQALVHVQHQRMDLTSTLALGGWWHNHPVEGKGFPTAPLSWCFQQAWSIPHPSARPTLSALLTTSRLPSCPLPLPTTLRLPPPNGDPAAVLPRTSPHPWVRSAFLKAPVPSLPCAAAGRPRVRSSGQTSPTQPCPPGLLGSASPWLQLSTFSLTHLDLFTMIRDGQGWEFFPSVKGQGARR